jgi:hypothetical protein
MDLIGYSLHARKSADFLDEIKVAGYEDIFVGLLKAKRKALMITFWVS